MQNRYSQEFSGQFRPAMPVFRNLKLSRDDLNWIYVVPEAIIDSGSDITSAPLSVLSDILHLAATDSVRVEGLETTIVDVDIEIPGIILARMRVSIALYERSEEVLIGRDILNQLALGLHGAHPEDVATMTVIARGV